MTMLKQKKKVLEDAASSLLEFEKMFVLSEYLGKGVGREATSPSSPCHVHSECIGCLEWIWLGMWEKKSKSH
jgi:hypothetical protein